MRGKLRSYSLYLIGACALVVLAGCGRSWLAEREPWRREAEITCLKSGAIKETASLVRIEPINGPGVCGADFPLKVVALGETSAIGFADNLRPPGAIPNSGGGPKWPIAQPRSNTPYTSTSGIAPSSRIVATPLAAPISIAPPAQPASSAVVGAYERSSSPMAPTPERRRSVFDAPESLSARSAEEPDENEDEPSQFPGRPRSAYPREMPVPLGRGSPVRALTPVEIKPAATLACPVVSALERWIVESVQPQAMRWFGQPVAEIKQISAYSCRGMNGNRNARISEHAFGNALDIASFTLADGRKVTVREGWRGAPEEQGFLRDIQGSACAQFATVLAPGSNIYHYDHIHVDLMRRSSGRVICEPDVVAGDVVAARAAGKGGYAKRGEPDFTGSVTKTAKRKPVNLDDEDEMENLARVPGED